MMTDTRIYGYYLGDGVAIHTSHYDPDRDGRPGEPGVYPLYSIEDDGNGLSCDECGEYIFEPYVSVIQVSDHVTDGLRSYDGWSLDDMPSVLELDVDYHDETLVLNVSQIDSHYGLVFTVTDGTRLLAVLATPDSPNPGTGGVPAVATPVGY